jgi:hypothetical protein
MATEHRPDVPTGVSTVAVLAIIIGAFELAGGLVLLIAHGHVDGYTSTQALAVGIVTLVIGAIYLGVGRGLLRLSPTALFVGLFVSGLKSALDLVALIGFGIDGVGLGALISLVINVVVFAALWSGRDAFDRGPAPARA